VIQIKKDLIISIEVANILLYEIIHSENY